MMLVKPMARFRLSGAALVLVGLFSGVMALGSSRFRLEAAYVSPDSDYFRISGMVDITRWLTARLSLIEVRPPPDFGLSIANPVAQYYPMDGPTLILSPWRGRSKVEPYLFAGIGFHAQSQVQQNATFQTLYGTAVYGLGIDRLLFFLPHAPSLFLEVGQSVFSGTWSHHFWDLVIGPDARIVAGLRF
jgi:hypothetical protein